MDSIIFQGNIIYIHEIRWPGEVRPDEDKKFEIFECKNFKLVVDRVKIMAIMNNIVFRVTL